MKKNLESVAQRGEHIDQLQDKSENLNQSAQGFRRGANRVRKQMWWKNVKMRIWILVGIIVLLLIIIIPSGTYLLSQYFLLRFMDRPSFPPEPSCWTVPLGTSFKSKLIILK